MMENSVTTDPARNPVNRDDQIVTETLADDGTPNALTVEHSSGRVDVQVFAKAAKAAARRQ